MLPGEKVADVLGLTVEDSIEISGDAFTSGKLTLGAGGQTIVVGETVPAGLVISTGTFTLTGTAEGVSNSPLASGPFASLTAANYIIPVTNSGSARNRTEGTLTNFEAIGTSDTAVFAFMIRVNAIPAFDMTAWSVMRDGGTNTPYFRYRIGSNGTAFINWDGTTGSIPLGTIEVGKWMLIVGQVTRSSALGATAEVRSRAWVNGDRATLTPTIGAVQAQFTNNAAGFEVGASATSAPNISFGFAWLWVGNSATPGLLDFNDAAYRDVFLPENLNLTTGAVTFPNDVSLTPKAFLHGTVADYNLSTTLTGLPNRGTWGGVVQKNNGTWTYSSFADTSISYGDPTAVSRTSWPDNDITLTTSVAKTGGQFALGDWWINGSGGLSVASIAPVSVQGVRTIAEGGSTASLWYHGAMLNPGNVADVAAYPAPAGSGGSSLQAFDGYIGQAQHVGYQHVLNKDPGATGAALAVTEGTIVKVASRTANVPTSGFVMPEKMAAFTILNGTPPTAAPDLYFRPGINATTKDLWVSTADLDLTMLPSLSAVTGAPAAIDVFYRLNRIHTNFMAANHNSSMNTASPYENKYGREYARDVADALLLMCLTATSAANKIALARCLVQIGIDMTDAFESGKHSDATAFGATSHGRKAALAFASLVTSNARMATALADTTWTADDRTIVPITLAMTTRPSDPYDAGLIGSADWTSSQADATTYPATFWTSAEGANVQYRHIYSVTAFGLYCGMTLIPGLETEYNYAPFFTYMERYWTEETARSFAGSGPDAASASNTLSKSPGLFYKNFRTTHTGLFV